MKNEIVSIFGPFDQVVTMRGLPKSGPIKDEQLEIITQGAVRVLNGKIIEIGNYKEIAQSKDQKIEFDYPSVVIPGFIDAHTHMCWAGTRAHDYALRLNGLTYTEIAKLGGGILNTVKKTREASLEELINKLKERLVKHQHEGVTTCEIKSGYGLNFEDEIKMLQAIQHCAEESLVTIVPTCLAAHIKPPEYKTNQDYLTFIIDILLPYIKEKKLSQRVDIFIEEGAFNPNEAFEYLLKAKKLGFEITVHADQFSQGGAKIAALAGAISADHLEVSEIEDMELLKKHHVIPIVLPGASLGLGLPFAPARKILDCGLSLVIASDWNPGSAPQGSLLLQASLLSAYEKLSMAETLAALTCRASHALNLQDRGKLDLLKRADMLVFNASDFSEILYYQGSLKPSDVICRGINSI